MGIPIKSMEHLRKSVEKLGEKIYGTSEKIHGKSEKMNETPEKIYKQFKKINGTSEKMHGNAEKMKLENLRKSKKRQENPRKSGPWPSQGPPPLPGSRRMACNRLSVRFQWPVLCDDRGQLL